MEQLPEDIHDYIVSYISDLEDLLTIPRINKQFAEIAKRYRQHLIVTDKEWTEIKWISVMHAISNVYRNINEIHFKRCNINEQALSGLLMRPMRSINLRECRQITNNLNWLSNLDQLKCTKLALAKCSKLPELPDIIINNDKATFNNLKSLFLDRQSFKETHCAIFAKRFSNLETLGIINSILYTIPLTFLTQLKHLKYLFLGGSNIFDKRLKNLLLNVESIFNALHLVEKQLKKENENEINEINEYVNISDIQNNDPLSSETKIAALIQALSCIFSIIDKLDKNGLKLIELSFYAPQNISLDKLYKYKEENYTDIHFDGLSIARLIFLHLMRKYYGLNLIILDFSSYPSKYGGLNNLFRDADLAIAIDGNSKYNDPDIAVGIQYVIDLATNEFGQTALHICCSDGDTSYVNELLLAGVYCDSRDRRGSTPLFQASIHNHYEIVNLLIKHGADIFKKKTTKETPMEIACMRSNVETIKIMLQSASIDNFNDNMKYDNQWSPIHCCCISGNTSILNLLINNGLNYAAQNVWKQTPLHICAIKNYVDCCTILINKYDLKQLLLRDEFNKTAQRIAAENNNHDIVKLIKYRRHELESNNSNNSNNMYQHQRRNYQRNEYQDYYGNNYNQRNYNYNQYPNNHRYYTGRFRGRGRGRGRGSRNGSRRTRGYYYRPKQK